MSNRLENLTINIKGHIVELLHKNGKHITFSIDLPDNRVRPALKTFPLKDRIKYFNDFGSMEDY